MKATLSFLLLCGGLVSCAAVQGFLGQEEPTTNSIARPVAEGRTNQVSVSINALDFGTYVFPAEKQKVWSALLDVIVKNYSILVLDEKSGIVATDWDTFYLDGQTRRNKISVRLSPDGPQTTKLILVNNDEVLKEKADNLGYLWLPSGDSKTEVKRIVKNTATLLGQITPEM